MNHRMPATGTRRGFFRAACAAWLISYCGALSGCAAHPDAIVTPVTVRVPVPEPVYCTVPKLKKPALPIARLEHDSTPADTIRAYAATVAILKGAVAERDVILAGCTRPGTPPAGPKETAR